MSKEEYKALVRRGWEEVINQRNLDFPAEAHPADAIWYEPDQDIQGIEDMKHYLALTFEAFPDFNVTVEDVIAEGEKVVSRYTFRGTHQGEMGSLALLLEGNSSSKASAYTALRTAR